MPETTTVLPGEDFPDKSILTGNANGTLAITSQQANATGPQSFQHRGMRVMITITVTTTDQGLRRMDRIEKQKAAGSFTAMMRDKQQLTADSAWLLKQPDFLIGMNISG
jgi:hypothetical protein